MASTQSRSCAVSMRPSETAFAVVPERPNSRASDFTRPITPARAAATIAQPELADPRGIADQADDAPVLACFEMRRRGVAAMDRAVKADVDLPLPIFRRRLGEALALRQAGIVDQDVEPAEIGDDLGDHRLDRCVVGDIGAISDRLAALRLDSRATTSFAASAELW